MANDNDSAELGQPSGPITIAATVFVRAVAALLVAVLLYEVVLPW